MEHPEPEAEPEHKILELVKKHNGFDAFNPMQEKCISAGVLWKSLVVSSPTASGKTVVAELAALESILNRHKKVVYTAPLRALASEHAEDFRRKYSSALSIKAALSTGDLDSSGANLGQKDMIFTTYEKADSLLNHHAEWLSQLGLLVIDELHSIGTDRGPTLEMLITKLRFLNPKMRVLGLSATIPNAKELAKWLGADLVESDYRPVKLREGIFLDGTIHFSDSAEEIGLEKDEVSSICLDTLAKGKQALVFVNTRRTSESTAKKLAELTENLLKPSEQIALGKAAKQALNVLETPTQQCETIASLIRRGACFHNAGLLQKQREIIEEMFKKNYLKFISATPTLAAGVNLPAFRVIVQSPYRYTEGGMARIPVGEYKQMAGRAGRPKYDAAGEAILIAKTEIEKDDYFDYFINGKVEDADSMLGSESQLRFHILSTIATGFIFDLDSAEKFFLKTFYALQSNGASGLFRKMTSIVKQLEEMGFAKADENRIEATPLGKRVAELYLDPLSAFSMMNSLRKNKLNDFSYLFTIAGSLEFYPWLSVPRGQEAELWEKIESEKAFLPIDVDAERFTDNDLPAKYWTSVMLKDWIEEVREQEIVETYKIQPGILRMKLQNADWLAYSCFELAKTLGLEVHFAPLHKMRKRLQAGIKEELIALCELRGIGRVRARRLFNAGVKGIADVKRTDVKDLEKVLGQKVAVKVKGQLEMKK
ncbi:ATP-dependent DNA helicase Hel308 [uncultured archaeon]|nr:ATP-dependent DNA helicase Hel308 [uncultured archaeon]